MNLLVITREFPPDIVGGMGYHLGYLYSKIAEKGHDVTILAGVCQQSKNVGHELVHKDLDIRRIQYGTFHAHHIWYTLALRNYLREFAAEEYDVALTHTHIPFELPLPTIQKYHDCTREQRPFFRKDMSSLKRGVDSIIDPSRKLVEQRSIHHLSHAIFNSDLCRKAWKNHYNFNPATSVIHNGVDTDLFYPRDTNFEDDYVLFIGDSERKGLPTILDYANDADVKVYLVGDTQIDHPNIEGKGRVDQERLAEFYSGAIATIHPAKFEAFGNVILESLACGTPVVVSDNCGAAELVDGTCGVVTNDIKAGIKRVRDIPPGECVNTASNYTWDSVAKQTIDLIKRFE